MVYSRMARDAIRRVFLSSFQNTGIANILTVRKQRAETRKTPFAQLEIEMSMKRVSLSLSLFAMIAFSNVANAHSGHGHPGDGNGITHYLTSPIHVLPILFAAILTTALLCISIRNRRLAMKRNR